MLVFAMHLLFANKQNDVDADVGLHVTRNRVIVFVTTVDGSIHVHL